MTRVPRGDFSYAQPFALDVRHGYLARSADAPLQHNPSVVRNSSDESMLRVLRDELKRAKGFLFSVAFVSPRAIALLKQELLDFNGIGRIVTSDYLGFNRPEAFAELLNLARFGIDVRIHGSKAFHPKGYLFQHGDSITAMVGSSNLTETALVTNHEWNLKVSATHDSDLSTQFERLIDEQLEDSSALTAEWLEDYRESYVPPAPRTPRPAGRPSGKVMADRSLHPNAMQVEALAAIAEVRAQGHQRALVISATGTGKTLLSAFDVRAVDPARFLFVVHREQILDRTILEYQRVLGGTADEYGKLTGAVKQGRARYVFATVQTLSQFDVLETFAPDAFDYIVVDEAHRAGSETYRRVLDHFRPDFLLGMTATPERTDGFNVFELFHFHVPYEIRLNRALEEDMLAPFHYYGVADVVYEDGTTTTANTNPSLLITPQRVDHLIDALTRYGQAGVRPRGLIFCSRKDEAHALALALNSRTLRGRPLRCVALTGEDSIVRREEVVVQLERGELDYILTVDVFNEGVDIPSVNQVVLLRQTQSAIVFVQQLGRGLRKAEGKEYLVVIDIIGNYTNNFLIPIALFGDNSLNKESVRKNLIAAEEAGVLPGLSSVRFDKISQARVLESISSTKLTTMARLKSALVSMQNRVGGVPRLWDFLRFDSTDPVLLATAREHYPALLKAALQYEVPLSEHEDRALRLVSREVFTARRLHEFVVLGMLLDHRVVSHDELRRACHEAGLPTTHSLDSAIDTLTLTGFAEQDFQRYGGGIAQPLGDGRISLTESFTTSYMRNSAFASQVQDIISTGAALVEQRYDKARPFTPGMQYSRKECARLLAMPRKWASTMYGYKADPERRTCPIFVTLHKAEDVSESTAYEDAIVDRSTMVWYTKSRRSLASELEGRIANNEYELHVFVKKDDAEGSDSYYLGEATVQDAEDTTMPGKAGDLSVVRMSLRFEEPIESALYDYFHPTVTRAISSEVE